MQIVINIPEEDYKFIKDLQFYHSGKRSGRTIEQNVINGIRNGIALPKGHGDLIDRDKFKSLMGEYFIDTSKLQYADLTNAKHFNWGIENCFNEIDEMEPVIDADKGVENEDSN